MVLFIYFYSTYFDVTYLFLISDNLLCNDTYFLYNYFV